MKGSDGKLELSSSMCLLICILVAMADLSTKIEVLNVKCIIQRWNGSYPWECPSTEHCRSCVFIFISLCKISSYNPICIIIRITPSEINGRCLAIEVIQIGSSGGVNVPYCRRRRRRVNEHRRRPRSLIRW